VAYSRQRFKSIEVRKKPKDLLEYLPFFKKEKLSKKKCKLFFAEFFPQ